MAVVHWGNPADTLTCLRSVAASARPASALIVVDNGTAALRDPDVRAAAPGAELLTARQNLGFAGGSNVAIRHALAAGAEYVLLLNNDATLEPDCVDELVRVALASPDVGAVGAKVLSASDPRTLWAAWGRVTWRAALVELVGQGEADGPQFDDTREVDWVSGCAMLLSRAALESVGLLDERFFAYHEDVDWCTTARSRGYRIVYAARARVRHRGSGSLGGRGPANPVRYLTARNTILFARKHAGLGDWVRLGVTIAASLPAEWLRRRREGQADVVRLLVRGYVDGLLGREVPYETLGLR